jgi:hypothetical protein
MGRGGLDGVAAHAGGRSFLALPWAGQQEVGPLGTLGSRTR